MVVGVDVGVGVGVVFPEWGKDRVGVYCMEKRAALLLSVLYMNSTEG